MIKPESSKTTNQFHVRTAIKKVVFLIIVLSVLVCSVLSSDLKNIVMRVITYGVKFGKPDFSNIIQVVENTYDSRGNDIKVEIYNSFGVTQQMYKSNYNSEGKIIKFESYDSDGKVKNIDMFS